MNPKDYGLAEQDFYQTEDKSLGLHRRALQTDLYILGLYIIKKYSSFAIFISEETFRSTKIQKNNTRHRDYKGLYKYYFFVKSTRNADIGIAKHKYWQEAFFYEDFEWFSYVYQLEDMNHIIGLLWGGRTFLDWEKRYIKENPRFPQSKKRWNEYFLKMLATTKRAFRNKEELLQAMKVKEEIKADIDRATSKINYQTDLRLWEANIKSRMIDMTNDEMKQNLKNPFHDMNSLADRWVRLIHIKMLEEKKGSNLNTYEMEALETTIWFACETKPYIWLRLLDPDYKAEY